MKQHLISCVFLGICIAAIALLALIVLRPNRSLPDTIPTVVLPMGKPVESRAILPSGLEVRASYHCNRNALAAMAIAPECVLALSDSGNLLQYDRNELRLTHER